MLDHSGDADVSEGDALVDKEGTGGEGVVESLQGTNLGLCEVGVNRLGIGGDPALNKAEDYASEDANLRVRKGDPLINKSGFLGAGAEEVGVGGKGRNCWKRLAGWSRMCIDNENQRSLKLSTQRLRQG